MSLPPDDASSRPPQDPTPAAARAPRRRWMVWALAASLCLNLVILGGAAGLALRGFPYERGMPPPPGGGLDPFTFHRMLERVPDAQRDDALKLIRRSKPDFDAKRAQWAASRGRIADALAAEPFDRDALLAAMEAARRSETEGRAALDRAFADFAGSLPAETRAELAEELRRRHGGRPEREHEHGRFRDDDRPREMRD